MDRVCLFTEEPVLAEGLACLLLSESEIELRVLSGSAASLVEETQAVGCKVLLFDFEPDQFGTLYEFRNRMPECRVVLWLRSISHELAFQTMRLGVRGILRKTAKREVLVKCLRTVGAGEMWFDKELTVCFLEAKTVALTARESQLVELVSQWLKNKQVATELGIAEATVRIYLSALFRKLGLQDRYELAIYGMKNMVAAQPISPDRGDQSGAGAVELAREQVCPRVLVLNKPSPKPAVSAQKGTPAPRPKVRTAAS